MKLKWDWSDWGLLRRKEIEGLHECWEGIFSLRCWLCGKFTLGCYEHWFCGVCEPCRQDVEDEVEFE